MNEAACSTGRRIHIRWMIRRDLPEVLAIEAARVDPWDEDEFVRRLRRRECIGMVAEDDGGRVVGFMVYVLGRREIVVERLVVHPGIRRTGVGSSFAGKLIGKLNCVRRARISLVARESNLTGLMFLRARGFRAVAILPGYFGDEDGYAMDYRLEAVE